MTADRPAFRIGHFLPGLPRGDFLRAGRAIGNRSLRRSNADVGLEFRPKPQCVVGFRARGLLVREQQCK